MPMWFIPKAGHPWRHAGTYKIVAQGDKTGLTELEKACLAQNAEHTDWECNESMMKLTKGGKALYEHCLPADITMLAANRAKLPNPCLKDTVTIPIRKQVSSLL